MKKTILAIAAALMMSVNMTAQENTAENKNERQRPDMTEMVKHRTDETAKKYGLNEEQAAKLLELNTKYMGQMGPRRGGMRQGRGMRPDSMRQQRQRPEGEMKEAKRPNARPEMNGQRPERRGDRQGFRRNMEEYNNELKKIMTEEQYKAYQEDMEKRMKEGSRRFRREQ